VSTTLGVHLELQISQRIFKKIRNGPNGRNGILRAGACGKNRFMKKPEVENLVALPLSDFNALSSYVMSQRHYTFKASLTLCPDSGVVGACLDSGFADV
jgi:hypothetical protein